MGCIVLLLVLAVKLAIEYLAVAGLTALVAWLTGAFAFSWVLALKVWLIILATKVTISILFGLVSTS